MQCLQWLLQKVGKGAHVVAACTCNPATLEAEFQDGVGSIPVEVTVLQ